MTSRLLQRVRDAITQGEYDVTIHAVEEMAEDGLDVESAVLNGEISKTESDDPRETRYTIIEKGANGEHSLA